MAEGTAKKQETTTAAEMQDLTDGFHLVSRNSTAEWEDLFGKFVALAAAL